MTKKNDDTPGWNRVVLLRYSLLQLPAITFITIGLLISRYWISIPLWLVYILVIVWIIKDIVLFPFIWRAYDPRWPRSNSLIGLTGICVKPLKPEGLIEVNGEIWQAKLTTPERQIRKGSEVRVTAINGLILHVEPVKKTE